MLPNKEGQKAPSTTLKRIQDGKLVDVETNKLFGGRKVIVFALPGAFTPTCSSTHLPGYNDLAPTFRQNGIDEIVCLSVNDAFVMDAWAKDQESQNVTLLADGNGDFSEAMGLLVDKQDLGFGKRSWRYSMLVNDGVIEKMFIEPEVEGDPFEVSDADTMLGYINPDAKPPKTAFLFAKEGCPHCARAKYMLRESQYQFTAVDIKEIGVKSLVAATGQTSVPQVFVDGKHIGSADDLESFLKG